MDRDELIQHVDKLHLERGDVVLVKVARVTPEEAERLRGEIQAVLSGEHKAMIIEEGVTIERIRPRVAFTIGQGFDPKDGHGYVAKDSTGAVVGFGTNFEALLRVTATRADKTRAEDEVCVAIALERGTYPIGNPSSMPDEVVEGTVMLVREEGEDEQQAQGDRGSPEGG